MTNLHLAEEIEFGRGPLLWDASPDVCCAAYQLGACVHTESFDPDEAYAQDEMDTFEEDPDVTAYLAELAYEARRDAALALEDQPF